MTVLDVAGGVRRKARLRVRAVSAGHVLPVVFALLAFVAVLALLRDRRAQTPVLVAARTIPAGTVVDAGDTRVEMIASSDAARLGGLLRSPPVGAVASESVAAGEPIVAGEIADGTLGGSLGEMSIPVPVDLAAGGALAAGDKVDVIDMSPSGAAYVAQGLTVLATASSSGGGLLSSSSTGGYWVTVAVGRTAELAISAALGTSSAAGRSVEVVRSPLDPAQAAKSSPSGFGCGAGGPAASGGCG